jgi:hypothetical protein
MHVYIYIYVISTTCDCFSSPELRNDIFVIDHIAKTSTDISSGVHGTVPTPRTYFACTAVAGKLYVMGGFSGSGRLLSPTNKTT